MKTIILDKISFNLIIVQQAQSIKIIAETIVNMNIVAHIAKTGRVDHPYPAFKSKRTDFD